MKHIFPKVIALVLAALAPALGGDKATVRFIAGSAPEDFGDVAWSIDGKERGSFAIPVNRLSEPFDVPQREFDLFSQKDKLKLAAISLPESGDSFVVMLIPEPQGTLKSLVIDADADSFRGGDVFLYNGTDLPVVGELGTSGFELAPGEGKPVRPGGDMANGSYDVVFKTRGDGGDRVLRSLRWPVQSRSRSYCFIFQNPTTARTDIHAVDEFLEPGEK